MSSAGSMETADRQRYGKFTRQDYNVCYTSRVRPGSVEMVYVGMTLGTNQGKSVNRGDGR